MKMKLIAQLATGTIAMLAVVGANAAATAFDNSTTVNASTSTFASITLPSVVGAGLLDLFVYEKAAAFSITGVTLNGTALSSSTSGRLTTWSTTGSNFTGPASLVVSYTGSNAAAGITINGAWNPNSTVASVTAVPEPETYAMMLAGLSVVGAVARRRKPTA